MYSLGEVFFQIKKGNIDMTTVMDIAKPLLENTEKEQGRKIDKEALKDDISKCTHEGR